MGVAGARAVTARAKKRASAFRKAVAALVDPRASLEQQADHLVGLFRARAAGMRKALTPKEHRLLDHIFGTRSR